jgi:hypothetical protein
VDLNDRILRTSRRIAVRRVVLSSVAGIAAVAVIGVGALALANPHQAGPVLPGESPSPSTPAPTEPTDSPSDSPSEPPSEPPRPTTAAPAAPPTFGTLGTLSLAYVGKHAVYRFTADGLTQSPIAITGATCGISISPDGTKLAWNTSHDSSLIGDLMVATISPTGLTGTHVVVRDALCGGGDSIHWLPDSQRLQFSLPGRPGGIVDIRSGTVSNNPIPHSVAWSPNSGYVTYTDQDSNGYLIVVARPDGTVIRQLRHHDEAPTGGFQTHAISDDGRYVVVGYRSTDPDGVPVGWQVVDTVTGADVSLPDAKVFSSAQVYPLPGGRWLVHTAPFADGTRQLVVISADREVTARIGEPTALSTIRWLRVLS